MAGDYPALHRLERALNPIISTGVDGPYQMNISGTVNTIGGGTGGTAMVDNNPFTPGGTSITPVGGYVGGRSIGSGNAGAIALSPSGLVLVDVRAGGAGGGIANLTVVGPANTALHVGYASGAAVNVDGGAYVPVQFPSGYYPTINTVGGGGGGFASAAVYGSPAFPIYNIGSVNVVNAVGIFGSTSGVASVNLGPGGIVGVFGSTSGVATVFLGNIPTVNLGLGTVNVGNFPGVQIVDTRGSLVPTTWPITGSGGVFQVIATAASPNRVYLYGMRVVTSATVDLQFQSPSGTTLDGSVRLLPGAGWVENYPLGTPAYIAPVGSGNFVFNLSAAAQVSGIARGWVGP